MTNDSTADDHTTIIKLHDVVRLEGCRVVSGSMRVTTLNLTISGGVFVVPGFDFPFPTDEDVAFDIEADLSTNLVRAGHTSETLVLWSDQRPLDFEINNVNHTMSLTDADGNAMVLPNRMTTPPTTTISRREKRREQRRGQRHAPGVKT